MPPAKKVGYEISYEDSYEVGTSAPLLVLPAKKVCYEATSAPRHLRTSAPRHLGTSAPPVTPAKKVGYEVGYEATLAPPHLRT